MFHGKILFFVSLPFKGPGKQRHIVADTICCRQKCYPVCPHVQHLLRTQILCWDAKNVSDFVQKQFGSITNVSQFAQHKKHHKQQCVLVCQGLNFLPMVLAFTSPKFKTLETYRSIVVGDIPKQLLPHLLGMLKFLSSK